jgi:hypothetical protein
VTIGNWKHYYHLGKRNTGNGQKSLRKDSAILNVVKE